MMLTLISLGMRPDLGCWEMVGTYRGKMERRERLSYPMRVPPPLLPKLLPPTFDRIAL